MLNLRQGNIIKIKSAPQIALIILFSLLLGASAAAHYFIYHQSSTRQALLSAQLTRLEQRQHNWQNEVQKLTDQLAQQAEDRLQIQQVITLQAEQLQQLQQHMAHISSDSNHHGWFIEVHQLIKRAAYTVWLEQDGRAADQLLQRADLMLATLHDVNVLPIRQALAQDREQLSAMYSFEGEPLIAQLMRLADQAADLPLVATQFPSGSTQHATQPPMVNTEHTVQGGWKQLHQYGIRFLKNFITIQHDGDNSACYMQPLSLEYQRECLRINLLLAAQAAAQYRTSTYQQALNSVIKGVSTHFDVKQQRVQTFLQQITVLYQRPKLSSLSQPFNSQQLLAQLLQEQPAKGRLPGSQVQ